MKKNQIKKNHQIIFFNTHNTNIIVMPTALKQWWSVRLLTTHTWRNKSIRMMQLSRSKYVMIAGWKHIFSVWITIEQLLKVSLRWNNGIVWGKHKSLCERRMGYQWTLSNWIEWNNLVIWGEVRVYVHMCRNKNDNTAHKTGIIWIEIHVRSNINIASVQN